MSQILASTLKSVDKIIHLNNDFSLLLAEVTPNQTSSFKSGKPKGLECFSKSKRPLDVVASNVTKRKVKCIEVEGKETSTKLVELVGGQIIFDELNSEARSKGVTIEVIAYWKLIEILKQSLQESHESNENDASLTTFLDIISKNLSRCNRENIGKKILQMNFLNDLSLHVIYYLIKCGMLRWEHYIKRLSSTGSNGHFFTNLTHVILSEDKVQFQEEILGEFLSVLTSIAYNDDLPKVSSFSRQLLMTLLHKILDHLFGGEQISSSSQGSTGSMGCISATSVIANIYGLVLREPRVSAVSMEKLSRSHLRVMLTYRPVWKLGLVLERQHKWRSSSSNSSLLNLMDKIVSVLGAELTLSILDSAVSGEEVNWASVLTLVASCLSTDPASTGILKGMIASHLRLGFEEQESDHLIIAFLFARHACLEGRHLFPSYSQWFSSTFGSERNTFASTKENFTFLIRFLTDLVPHESVDCLRIHVSKAIHVPKGCHQLMHDYVRLARVRLNELNVYKELPTESHTGDNEAKLVAEVENAVNEFQRTHRIPNLVLEASIFRKPHFLNLFLPSLLTPRLLPDCSDGRMELIQALFASGKIPASQHQKYLNLCKKEAADLLDGVFLDGDEDKVVKEPLAEVETLLSELPDPDLSSNEKNSPALRVLSRLAQMVEDLTKGFHVGLSTSTSHLLVDPRPENEIKNATGQLVDLFVSTIERVCVVSHSGVTVTEGGESSLIKSHYRPTWLPQLVSILSTNSAIQTSFFAFILRSLALGNMNKLMDCQIKVLGITLCELTEIAGLFLPVKLADADPTVAPEEFVGLFLQRFSMFSSFSTFMFADRLLCYWVDWWLEWNESPGETTKRLFNLMNCLMPRLHLMLQHQLKHLSGQDSLTVGYKLFVTDKFTQCSNEEKLPLETWVKFELKTPWLATPLDARVAYLQTRLTNEFGTTQKNDETPNGRIRDVFLGVFHILLKNGNFDINASELTLTLHALSNACPRMSLLNEWKTLMNDSKNNTDGIPLHSVAFISICRCLPTSLFLATEHVGILLPVYQIFCEQLVNNGNDLVLSCCDTIFLLCCVLRLSDDCVISDTQVDRMLLPIRSSVVFHWDSVHHLIEGHVRGDRKPRQCFYNLNSALQVVAEVVGGSKGLGLEDEAALHLSLCLRGNSDQCGSGIAYVKWMFAFLGREHTMGNLPLLPPFEVGGNQSDCPGVRSICRNVINGCCRVVESYTARTFGDLLTSMMNDKKLRPIWIQTGAMFLCLVCLAKVERKQGNNLNPAALDFTLQCLLQLRLTYESCTVSEVTSHISLQYLTDCSVKLTQTIRRLPVEFLESVNRGLVARCDQQIQMAFQSHSIL